MDMDVATLVAAFSLLTEFIHTHIPCCYLKLVMRNMTLVRKVFETRFPCVCFAVYVEG
jgi:hypothetical protein